MERELSRDDCVGLMPEWKELDPQIESLSGGITNKLYRVRTSDGGDYVVRDFGTKTELFIDRDVEAGNLRLFMIVGADVNEDFGYQKVNNAAFGAQIEGIYPNIDFVKIDLTDNCFGLP